MTQQPDPKPKTYNPETSSGDENAGARAAEIDANPEVMAAESENAAAGEAPNAAGGPVPSSAEVHVPSSSDPQATNLPSSDAADPQSLNPKVNPSAADAPSS